MEKVIQVGSLVTLGEKLTKLNKKFAKRAIAPISIVNSQLHYKTYDVGMDAFMEPIIVKVPWYEVTLSLPVDNAGFENTLVLGYVEQTTGGAMILHPMSDGAAPKMEALRGTPLRCDHCKTKRARLNTFIFERDGKNLMIGKQCAREYFGFDIAVSLTEFIGLQEEKGMGDEEYFGSRGRAAFDQQLFLAACLFLIKREGFRSQKYSDATAFRAHQLNEQVHGGGNSATRFSEDVLDQYRAEGKNLIEGCERILQFFHDLQTKEPFLLNCKAALADPFYSRQGLLAAAVNTYFYEAAEFAQLRADRTKAKLDKEAAKLNSTHYGSIGERITMEAQIAGKHNYDSEWGGGVVVKMTTDNGSELVWFTSADTYEFEIGHYVKVTGRVKKHDEYKGVKQTTLGRCKLVRL